MYNEPAYVSSFVCKLVLEVQLELGFFFKSRKLDNCLSKERFDIYEPLLAYIPGYQYHG